MDRRAELFEIRLCSSILAFWSGSQNSRVRAHVKKVWEDDEDILLGGGRVLRQKVRGPDYFENFRKAKYCLHITGYQVIEARTLTPVTYESAALRSVDEFGFITESFRMVR